VKKAGVSPSSAPHGVFWKRLNYEQFTTGTVPGVGSEYGGPYKILEVGDSKSSTIIQILQGIGTAAGNCGQMPLPNPPYNPEQQVLIDALAQWIDAGCPNHQALTETEAPIQVAKALLQQTYSWKATGGDNNPQAIRIDARLFNRHEGCEVIPMIQKVVNHFGYGSPADVQKVEALIGSELPGNVRGRKKVFDWLVGRLA